MNQRRRLMTLEKEFSFFDAFDMVSKGINIHNDNHYYVSLEDKIPVFKHKETNKVLDGMKFNQYHNNGIWKVYKKC